MLLALIEFPYKAPHGAFRVFNGPKKIPTFNKSRIKQ